MSLVIGAFVFALPCMLAGYFHAKISAERLLSCREEDAAARKSRIAQQREEALKRADAHAAEELQRARHHERQQAAEQRWG